MNTICRGGKNLKAVFVPIMVSKMRLGGLSHRHLLTSLRSTKMAQKPRPILLGSLADFLLSHPLVLWQIMVSGSHITHIILHQAVFITPCASLS